MSIIHNLTPHAIRIFDNEGNCVHVFESEGVARAKQISSPCFSINGIEVVRNTYSEVTDLPDYQKDVYYIVSVITYQAARANGRTTDDLLLTDDAVRNEEGQIIGCKRFAVIQQY